MKYFLVVIIFMSLSSHAWTDESVCPANGTKVEFRQADEVYEFLSSQEIEKDEFETTAQFEKRRDELNAELAGSPVMVIKNNWYFSDFGGDGSPEYDADNQRFVMGGFICEHIDEEGDTIFRSECRRDFRSKFICDDNRDNSISDSDFECNADLKNAYSGEDEHRFRRNVNT